jgi:hypothetical protein
MALTDGQFGGRVSQEPRSDVGVVSAFKDLGLHLVRRPAADTSIIFVHGVLSGGETAWGKPRWPDLIAAEVELRDIGVFVFSYRTSVSSRTYSVSDAADALREYFPLEELWQQRRLLFVCHSLGGIVVRRFIVANQLQLADRKIELGLFLVASPSLGSLDANAVALLASLLRQTQLLSLRFSQTNTWLNDLDRDFGTLRHDGRIKMQGKELIEDRAIAVKRWLGLRRQIVEPFAAARYFGEPVKIPGSDHISICKPGDPGALQHRILKRFAGEFARPLSSHLSPTNEHETTQALDLLTRLRSKIDTIVPKHEAYAALHEALSETRQYVVHRQKGGPRDPIVETRLSEVWSEVGRLLSPHDADLANLSYVKGHGWADERVWEDPRFRDLPLRLNDLLARMVAPTESHVLDLDRDVKESRQAIRAISENLNRFENVTPVLQKLLNPRTDIGAASKRHAVTHAIADKGHAVEFSGYGNVKRVTVEDLAKLPKDDRRAIAASDAAMRKLMREWNKIVRHGTLSKSDEQELLRLAALMQDRLNLVFQVVETALGGVLEDHYAAQRAIAQHASARYKQVQAGVANSVG